VADGEEIRADHGDPLLWLQWCTADVPYGVTTTWVEGDDAGEDPARGRVRVEDPDWDEAVDLVVRDPDYLASRGRLGGVVLSVVLREDVEPEIRTWSVDEEYDVTHVVLRFPAADLRGLFSRTPAYVDMVIALAASAVDHLDL
jgi:hypothetical protein